MYVQAKDIRYIAKEIIQTAIKIADEEDKENVIEKAIQIAYPHNGVLLKMFVQVRRVCYPEYHHVFIAAFKKGKYPVDIFDLFKYLNHYTVKMIQGENGVQYHIDSLKNVTMGNDAVLDLSRRFLTLITES